MVSFTLVNIKVASDSIRESKPLAFKSTVNEAVPQYGKHT
jgi:hypothetical protein